MKTENNSGSDEGEQDEGDINPPEFPVTVEAEEVTFETLPSGELQTRIDLTSGEELVQISRIPDSIYDQLMEVKNDASD